MSPKVCVDYSFVCVINCFLVLCNDVLMWQKAVGVTGLSSQMLRLRHVASAMRSFAVLFESWLS
ncbi:hypothetical protein Hanom_Chr11g01014631 [Helianthus anomalus]